MLAELVFLSRFLGLTYGEGTVILRADPDVKRVELRRDGATMATLAKPPWAAKVDFGPDLGPYELTAVGFGVDGTEVARDTQLVNLARPAAEALIILERKGETLYAKLLWLHINGTAPTAAVLEFDGKVVSRASTAVPVSLGKVTDSGVHVVSAELEFPDGNVRKEIVFGGLFSETMPAELTAVAVKQLAEVAPAEARCIRAGGKEIAPVGVENGTAHVAFVVNGTAPAWVHVPRRGVGLPDTELHIVSPVLRRGQGANYFPIDRVPRHLGMREALRGGDHVKGKKYFAEALGAAAMRALRMEKRRALVYVLGKGNVPDHSVVDPVQVRRYLARVGVPLRVWSLTGPRPDMADRWGAIEDVSTPEKLRGVVASLHEELAQQRIAWLPAAPLDAYRATATPDCAYQPLSVAAP